MAASAKLMDRRQLTDQVKAAARNAGFELVGVVSMDPATDDPPMPGCDDADPDGWQTRDANYHRINDGRLEGPRAVSHCRSPDRAWRRVG